MTFTKTLAAAAVAAALTTTAAQAQVPESEEPIRMALNEWTGQHISTILVGEVLKGMGYNVEYITAGYYTQLTALTDGDLDVSMEIWTSNIGEGFDEGVATGKIRSLGESGLRPQEAWYVPAYVVEMCPGLPDYTALRDCADLFTTPETMPDGRFLDYPAEWGDTNAKRIEALGLPLVPMPSGGEGALIAEIRSAVERKAPLLVMFWEPHWLHAQVDLQRVYLPEYVEGCTEDTAVGIDPEVAWDCDWAPSEAMKVVNVELEATHPAAWEVIESFDLTNEEQAEMMSDIDDKGRDLEEVVREWMAAHPERVQTWIDAGAI